jgi:hypothetical protein
VATPGGVTHGAMLLKKNALALSPSSTWEILDYIAETLIYIENKGDRT